MLQLKESLTARFNYIYPEDPAVDKDSQDYDPDGYEETLDPDKLPMQPGSEATVFVCKPLERRAMNKVITLHDSDQNHDAAQVAVAYSLVDVKNGPEDLELTRLKDGSLDGKSLDALYNGFGYTIFSKVGGAIMRRSTASPF